MGNTPNVRHNKCSAFIYGGTSCIFRCARHLKRIFIFFLIWCDKLLAQFSYGVHTSGVLFAVMLTTQAARRRACRVHRGRKWRVLNVVKFKV